MVLSLSLTFSLKQKQSIKLSKSNIAVVMDQDDSSTSSTEAVDSSSSGFSLCTHSHHPLTSSSSSSSRKGVRFAEDLNKEYSNLKLYKADTKALWYSPADYRVFRAVAIDASQQVVAMEKRNRAPYSYQRVLERTYAVCCDKAAAAAAAADDDVNMNQQQKVEHQHQQHKNESSSCSSSSSSSRLLAPADFVHLQRWLEVANCRVGLEKWCIRTIASDKSVRREAMIEAVMSAQSALYSDDDDDEDSATSFQAAALNDSECDDPAELIRAACERLSRPSRFFSRALAQGLAAAVEKECFYDGTAALVSC